MLKSTLHISVAVVLLAAAMLSCNKNNGINNNQVIETPYGLYYADSTGALYNTNDGTDIKPMVFPPDGFAPRSIVTAGMNILYAKVNLSYSTNNGANFNPSYSFINPLAITANCMFYAADEKRVYISSTTGALGIAINDSNGYATHWQADNNDTAGISGTITVTSFTQLANNNMVAYDFVHNRIFIRANIAQKWYETTGSNSATNLPAGSEFFVSHFANTIIAVDQSGLHGAYYSTDLGKTWTAYKGLPSTSLLSVAAPFDQVLLVGTDSYGVYQLGADNVFHASNNGLGSAIVVNGIVAKQNILKSVTAPQQYVFLATNQGLYRSDDLGSNWIKVQTGNIVALY